MHLEKINSEVFGTQEQIVKVSRHDIEFLKKQVQAVPRGRVRLCAHGDNSDPLHEMLIVLSSDTYIRPHKHFGKSESVHVIEGIGDLVVIDDNGCVSEVIKLGDAGSGRIFYYRMHKPVFHTLVIRSDLLVLHETTNGPFRAGEGVFAPWSPREQDRSACKLFMENTARAVERFTEGSHRPVSVVEHTHEIEPS